MTPQQQIDALEGRVQLLEEALGLTYQPPPVWGLTPAEARLVGLLMKADYATRERIETALSAARNAPLHYKSLDVMMWKTRAKLKRFGVEIRNIFGVGFFIPADQKALLAQA